MFSVLYWLCVSYILVCSVFSINSLKLSDSFMSVNWVIIGSGNGLPLVRWQAITSTNAALLSIRPQQTYFKENIFENQKFPIMKIDMKCCLHNGHHVINNVSIVAGEWRHQCLVASVSMDLLIYHITPRPVYKYSNAHIIVHKITLLPFGTGNTHIKLDLLKCPCSGVQFSIKPPQKAIYLTCRW